MQWIRSAFFIDNDGDGFGISSTVLACQLPPGTGSVGGDCDDSDEDINPAATENLRQH